MDDQQYTADAIRVLQEVAQTSGGPLSAEEQTVLASRNGVAIGRYAQTVIKGRWADAERLLLKHAGSISLVQYAEKVIKGRWPEYGRTVGHVIVDGRDVNLEMLEEGMAWHYKHYDHNARLARVEEEARAAKKGLWSDGEAVPPWDWRKEHQHRKAIQ